MRSAGGRSTPTNLVIVPDERVPAGRLVEVMDAAKRIVTLEDGLIINEEIKDLNTASE